MKNINRFGELAGLVKNVKRAGCSQVESVGDHSAKIAFLTLYLREINNLDYLKCLQMALVHDIAEGIVGDFTPYDQITAQQKFQKEKSAVERIFEPLGEQNNKYFCSIWMEYEQGLTYQAQVVKDLDKLEMIQQAFAYEKQHKVDLKEFYLCIPKMKTEIVKTWAEQLLNQRSKHFQK